MQELSSQPSSAQKSKPSRFYITIWQHLYSLVSGLATGSTSDAINEVRMKRPMSRTEVGSSRLRSASLLACLPLRGIIISFSISVLMVLYYLLSGSFERAI